MCTDRRFITFDSGREASVELGVMDGEECGQRLSIRCGHLLPHDQCSCGSGRAPDGRYADVVAVCQFLQRRALRAASGGLFLLRRVERRGPPHWPALGLGAAPAFGGAGADKVALNVCEAAQYRQHQTPGAGAGVGPWLGHRSKLRLRVHDALDDAEQVERAARQPVDACHRHHVAGVETVEHAQKLAPVGPRAGHLLAVDVATAATGRAQLLKLAVEGLLVGADAGIADQAFFGVIRSILRQL